MTCHDPPDLVPGPPPLIPVVITALCFDVECPGLALLSSFPTLQEQRPSRRKTHSHLCLDTEVRVAIAQDRALEGTCSARNFSMLALLSCAKSTCYNAQRTHPYLQV